MSFPNDKPIMKALEIPELIKQKHVLGADYSIGEPCDSDVIQMRRVFCELCEVIPRSVEELFMKCSIHRKSFGMFWSNETPTIFEEIRAMNTNESDDRWWGRGPRPKCLIMVSSTDGFIVLINALNEAVFAFSRYDEYTSNAVVARDFVWLVRGAGTLDLHRDSFSDPEKEAVELAMDVGSDDSELARNFWREFAYT